MSKDQWFREFERNLAESDYFDTGDDAAYQKAGERAYEALREAGFDRADIARKREREQDQ